MKDWKDLSREDLEDVCRQLYEGIWGDNIQLNTPFVLTPSMGPITDTAKAAKKTIEHIHVSRILRVATLQAKHPELDVLLMGVTQAEYDVVEGTIKNSLRDYLRPLADLIGLWDDVDDDDDPQPGDADYAAAVAPPEEGPVDPKGEKEEG